jgi:hypothetical protein
MEKENNISFYQVLADLLNPFNYLFGCGGNTVNQTLGVSSSG